jgi:hypothetical protein
MASFDGLAKDIVDGFVEVFFDDFADGLAEDFS